MAAAGLVVAPLQLLARTVEEQRGDLDSLLLGQGLHAGDDPVRIKPAGARIETDRQRHAVVARGVAAARDELVQEAHREIVDRLPAQVFQHLEHGRLARAEQARDQKHALPAGLGRGLARRGIRLRIDAHRR
jgi:hypothetical protein